MHKRPFNARQDWREKGNAKSDFLHLDVDLS
jgi:hypothetical protein